MTALLRLILKILTTLSPQYFYTDITHDNITDIKALQHCCCWKNYPDNIKCTDFTTVTT